MSGTLRISDLSAAASRLRDRLAAARTRARPQCEWYPYDSLSNVSQLERLLGSRYDSLLQDARSKGVLDIGCADGDLAFLFESLGCRVTAVDHPLSNHNHMRGIRALQLFTDVRATHADQRNLLAGVPERPVRYIPTGGQGWTHTWD